MNKLAANELQMSIDDYMNFKMAEGLSVTTINDMRYRLRAIMRDINAESFASIDDSKVIDWFVQRGVVNPETGRPSHCPGTRSRNWVYLNGFFEWAIGLGKLDRNPVKKAPRAKNQKKFRGKIRRALTAEELERLILVARYRPLAEYMKLRMVGSRNSEFWEANPITFDNVFFLAEYALNLRAGKVATDRLARDGAKWALAYRMLALTGLRWNELRTLTVGRLVLTDGLMILDSNFTKNGNADRLPIPAELVADLKAWIEENNLGPNDVLMQLPGKGVTRFYADIAVAGIPRVDDLGREVDIHALRKSFGTMLARASTPIAVCMKLMRHSKAELTLSLYQDAEILDFRGASNGLPALGSTREPVPEPVEEPKAVAPASPTASGNDALLRALLKNADPELLRKALLDSMGQ